MPKEYTPSPKLKLILDHLNALRTLDEYVNGVGLKADMQGMSHYLQQELNLILRPAEWVELSTERGFLYSRPKSKWSVVRGDHLALEIFPAWPLHDDDEPSVGLYVPANWKKRSQFIDKLKPPPGFEHVSQYPDGALTETSSIFKYIKYASYVGSDGVFDFTGFTNAFRGATKTLVTMEKTIDGVLKRLA